MAAEDHPMKETSLKARANDSGPALLAALEQLLSFPQNQDATDPKLLAAIRHAQKLVDRVRRPT
jgi:hypothetical protein